MDLIVDIEKIGHRGVGIGRYQGKVILVPFTAPGDLVKVRITASHRDYEEAEVTCLVEPSPLRRDPPCPFFAQCGGCHLQHLAIGHQRSLKEHLFRELMVRKGSIAAETLQGILSGTSEFGYRSRIEAHVLWKEKTARLGFMARNSRTIVPVDSCLLALPPLRLLFSTVPPLLEETRAFQTTKVDMMCDESEQSVVLTLCNTGRLSPASRYALKLRAPSLPHLKGLYTLSSNNKLALRIWERHQRSGGTSYAVSLDDGAPQFDLEVWPGVFRQINPSVNRILLATALSWIKEKSPERVIDLYAGMGNFAIPASFVAQEVVAVESNSIAVENAKHNARRLNRDNIQWITGSVKHALGSLVRQGESFDLAIMDPPRTGAKDALTELLSLNPKALLYISCDPPTLVRDIGFLQRHGSYRVVCARPVDMFPQTFHLESITLLERESNQRFPLTFVPG